MMDRSVEGVAGTNRKITVGNMWEHVRRHPLVRDGFGRMPQTNRPVQVVVQLNPDTRVPFRPHISHPKVAKEVSMDV